MGEVAERVAVSVGPAPLRGNHAPVTVESHGPSGGLGDPGTT